MPFIVTTKRPITSVSPFASRGSFERDSLPVVSRVAVATLEEVPCGCGKPHLGGTEHADECPVGILLANATLRALLSEPFTIGPLPDGTTVEVEPTTACTERCAHSGPFAWLTSEGWQVLDDEAVARGLIYDHGVTVYAARHAAFNARKTTS